MPHARLTHSSRPTLEFRQAQIDDGNQSADENVIDEVGTGGPPLVHVESREREHTIQGLVTAPRRARNDPNTNDWEQALANYLVELERRVDTLQGDGYTFEDDLANESFDCVYHAVEWTLQAGRPYEVEFDATVTAGQGVLGSESLSVPSVTVGTFDAGAKLDGNLLPGLRQLTVRREFGIDPMPLYDKSSAEVNDIQVSGNRQHRIVFEGTWTGDDATRRGNEDTIEALVGQSGINMELRLPGYTLTGTVLDYSRDYESTYGTDQHQYRVEFLQARDV
jgi:hypothetical protein